MRMIFTLLGWLALAGAALAQVPMTGAGLGAPGGGGPPTCTPDTAVTNYSARLTSPTATETYATCTLIKYLEAQSVITGNLSGATGCGTFGPLDFLYLFAFSSTTNANLNVCGTSYGLTKVGTVTLTNDQGYTGDGTTGYFTTGFTTGQMSSNSGFLGGYFLTNTSSGIGVAAGSFNGTNYNYVGPCNTGTCAVISEIQGSAFNADTTANSFGFVLASRSSSTNVNVYKSGTLLSAHTDSGTGQPTVPLFVGALNSNNSTVTNFNSYLTMAVIGGKDVSSLQGVIYTGLHAYCVNMGISSC